MLANLPQELQKIISGYDWQEITLGESGAQVFFLQGKHNFYLKTAPIPPEFSLLPEKQRLEWLQGKLPVPELLYFGCDESREYLLTAEINGLPASEPIFQEDMARLVEVLATGLRLLHSLPIADCPFDRTLNAVLVEAEQRVQAGLVDESDFDEERLGRTAVEIYQELVTTRPATEDLVFTHGDYCLPNILLNPQTYALNGFIDWGRAGIADRYQDIALAARSLDFNTGPDWVSYLFECYGLDAADVAKIEYYKLLDEFF